MREKAEFLECGRVINTHGVKGAVKLDSYCDTPQILAKIKTLYFLNCGKFVPRKVLKTSVFKKFVIAEIEGITDIDMAIELKNQYVYAARADLNIEEGAFLIADLVGLPVTDDETGELIGTFCDVINNGATDLYVIKTESGEKLVPAVPEFVKKIDVDSGIILHIIPGLLD